MAKTKTRVKKHKSPLEVAADHFVKEHISEPPFIFSLNLGGNILVGKGATALEALRAIPVPNKIMSKGVLTISQGDKKKEMLFMVPRLKRIFYHNAQPILIKMLAMGLK